MSIMKIVNVIKKIDEFEAQCQAVELESVEYTDTAEVWELLESVKEELKSLLPDNE